MGRQVVRRENVKERGVGVVNMRQEEKRGTTKSPTNTEEDEMRDERRKRSRRYNDNDKCKVQCSGSGLGEK